MFGLILGIACGGMLGLAFGFDRGRRKPLTKPAWLVRLLDSLYDAKTPFDISPPVVDDEPEIEQLVIEQPEIEHLEIEPATIVALGRTSGAHAKVDPAADATADLIFVGIAAAVEPLQTSDPQPVLEYPLDDDEVVGVDETGATAPAIGRLRTALYVRDHLDTEPDAAEAEGAETIGWATSDVAQAPATTHEPLLVAPPLPDVPLLFDQLGAPEEALAARTGFEKPTGAWQMLRPGVDIQLAEPIAPVTIAAPTRRPAVKSGAGRGKRKGGRR